ncbi:MULTISPECIES: hypothetical protein [unclassified Streptomyces]|uniref:hypothetical protein n=1 Tax=unclassified Streptomyces TaxID=2593676 RepID=UPI0035DD2EFA
MTQTTPATGRDVLAVIEVSGYVRHGGVTPRSGSYPSCICLKAACGDLASGTERADCPSTPCPPSMHCTGPPSTPGRRGPDPAPEAGRNTARPAAASSHATTEEEEAGSERVLGDVVDDGAHARAIATLDEVAGVGGEQPGDGGDGGDGVQETNLLIGSQPVRPLDLVRQLMQELITVLGVRIEGGHSGFDGVGERTGDPRIRSRGGQGPDGFVRVRQQRLFTGCGSI